MYKTIMKRLALPIIFSRRILLDAWNPTRTKGPLWTDLCYHAELMEIFRATN